MANFVLVHGSWHGAWCWYKVVPRLVAQGHRAIAVDLPGHGRNPRVFRGAITLRAMASSVIDVLEALPEPAIVVAHSRNGIVASTVAERRPDLVAKLVYLASYMLEDGERAADYFAADADSHLRPHVRVSHVAMSDALHPRAYREGLYADCDEADIALAQALLCPEPSLPALSRLRLSAERYGRVERHYIELLCDRAVSPALQRKLRDKLPCATVSAIDASHSAYFSRPDELVDRLLRIAVHGQ